MSKICICMASDLEKAQLMSVLARSKGNWGDKYDRTEHFKRFPHLEEAIEELQKEKWILATKKKFKAISLDTRYKKEIVEFIEKNMPEMKGVIK